MHRATLAVAVFLVSLILSVGATASLARDTADSGVIRIQSRSRGAKSHKRKRTRAKLKKG
jgi:hypothetical protein